MKRDISPRLNCKSKFQTRYAFANLIVRKLNLSPREACLDVVRTESIGTLRFFSSLRPFVLQEQEVDKQGERFHLRLSVFLGLSEANSLGRIMFPRAGDEVRNSVWRVQGGHEPVRCAKYRENRFKGVKKGQGCSVWVRRRKPTDCIPPGIRESDESYGLTPTLISYRWSTPLSASLRTCASVFPTTLIARR